jgi:PhnB protein
MSDPTNTTSAAYRVTVTPYLCVPDTAQAIAFYQAAFGATEVFRITDPAGRISHAEIQIGGVPLYVSDEFPEIRVLSPATLGGSPVMLVMDVADVDALFAQAVAAGATIDRPVADQFDGALRNGKLVDPFGHRWMLSTTRRNAAAPDADTGAAVTS